MDNQNTCVRCGKPCAAGEIMCPECNQWFQEQTQGKNQNFKKVSRPAAKQPRQVSQQPTQQTAPAQSASAQTDVRTAPVEQAAANAVVGTNQKVCVNCGKAISSISRFCPKCGWDQNQVPDNPVQEAPVQQAAPQETAAQPEPQPEPRQTAASSGAFAGRKPSGATPAKKGSKRLIPIVAAIAAVAVLAVVLVLVLGGKEKPGKTEPEEDISLGNEANTGAVVPEFDYDPGPSGTPEFGTGTALPEENEPETPEEVVPVVACIQCGATMPGDAQFCPYCGWDQMVPIEAEPEEITATLCDGAPELDGLTAAELWVSGTDQSSVVTQSGNHDNTAGVLVDGNLETSWQEGVDGDGIDEWVSVDLTYPGYVTYLRLYLGNWRSAEWYEKNNVPKVLEIALDDQTFTVEFPYDRVEHWVAFSEPVPCSTVRLTVKDVYAGSQYDDTCIAEMMIYGYSE